MWWCCGKANKEAQGCKFQKHESKNEDEDSDEGEEKKSDANRHLRCISCREHGHTAAFCPRDPNIKTINSAMLESEIDRIQRIKDAKKLYMDTLVQTTHMLKKTVMIPLKTDEQGKVTEQPNVNHPFMRGVMEFDDFNYGPYNNMILLPEPIASSPKQAQHHVADDKSVALSLKTIDRFIDDEDYTHEDISLPLTPE